MTELINEVEDNSDLFENGFSQIHQSISSIIETILQEKRLYLPDTTGIEINPHDALVYNVFADYILDYGSHEVDENVVYLLVKRYLFGEITNEASLYLNTHNGEFDLTEITASDDCDLPHFEISRDEVIEFMYTEEANYFYEQLSPKQRAAVQFYFENNSINRDPIKVFGYKTSVEADAHSNNFYHAFMKIRDYLQYLTLSREYINLNGKFDIFTPKTAPLFWKEQQLKKGGLARYGYEIVEPTDNIITEFLTGYALNRLIQLTSVDIYEKITYFLYNFTDHSIKSIAQMFSVSSSKIRRSIDKTQFYIDQNELNFEEILLKFLKLQPSEKHVLTKSLQNKTNQEITEELNTSRNAVARIRSQLLKLGYTFPDLDQFGFGDHKTKKLNSRFENGFDALFNQYLNDSKSKYIPQLVELYFNGYKGLIELYFLLQDTPDKNKILEMTGYSDVHLKLKLTELKRALITHDHPAYTTKNMQDWVELTDKGRFYLLDNIDKQILLAGKSANSFETPDLTRLTGFTDNYIRVRRRKITQLFEESDLQLNDIASIIK